MADHGVQHKLAQLEIQNNGRLGVFAINTSNHKHIAYRANERFPMGCTSKVMGVATVLHQSMNKPSLMQRKIRFRKNELKASGWTPITSQHLKDGMTVSELSAAAITHSDNLAMNLLLEVIKGPKTVNAFAQSIGDQQFRMDRWYPEEASSIPGDQRDTSTPKAMAHSLQKLVLGNGLAPQQKNT